MLRVLCTALSTETGPHHQILRDAGFDVVVADRKLDLYTTAGLLAATEGIDAVIAGSEPWPRAVLEARPKIRVLSRTGVGFDAIDLPACDERRVVVATTPGVNHHAVAEHTLALLLGLVRGFPRRDQTVRNNVWERPSTPRLMGRTVGVVGLGRIGQAVVEKLAGFGVRVVGYDPYPNSEFVRRSGVELLSFDDLLAQSDYLTLHLPVNRETTKIINAQSLAKLKPGAVLINTARGALVDEPALIEALQSGRLRAAGLDVFAQEPLPPTSPLLSMSQVYLSGHIAGLDDESQFDTLTMSADTILQLSRGQWPADRIQNLKGISDWRW
jgi:phosphoglycerate dehydrogenase-like enzyme